MVVKQKIHMPALNFVAVILMVLPHLIDLLTERNRV
jgi:hypothetical protein